MIEEYGTIVELKSNRVAVVLCSRGSACDHCPSSGTCQAGDDGDSMQVEAFNAVGAAVSDRVKVVTSTKHFLQSSFILYIVPIIGLLIGAVIGQVVAENTDLGIDPSLLSALFAVAFLAGSFLAIRIVTRTLKPEVFMPRIVEIQSLETNTNASQHGH
ncbi:MAG: SoxR reducing system RseC family protein [Deltaproteobacteria bacterium]|nr:SoxR reducing system RseC family protein [Deltaproteobacteria bacterium]